MKWIGEPVVSKGVAERGFEITCEDRRVPGLLWRPERGTAPQPLVLIGHGGSGQKREPHILSLARRLVRHNGISAAAIDGPAHGDRAPAGLDSDDIEARRSVYARPGIVEEMIADWKATLDALQKQPEIGMGPVGYWGLSMGTMFGLPFVAAEPRVSVAVLGLMGALSVPDSRISENVAAIGERLLADAAEIRCPVLFLQQLEDELIPREAVMALFDALGTADKRLHANPGPHADVPPDEFSQTQSFLAERLSEARTEG
jgi:dienelactone hydrolase